MPVVPGPDAVPSFGVCTPWITVDQLDCLPESPSEDLLADLQQYVEFASETLYLMSGQRFPGECTDTVWPTIDPAWCRCGCGTHRRCGLRRDRVELKGPITEITEVRVDGEVVPPTEYRVLDSTYLLGIDSRSWPWCQPFNRSSPVGTFSVQYSYGSQPPNGGVIAAGTLACELAKGTGLLGGECRLPQRVTSIQRQNVSMVVLDPLTLFADGLTGLPTVDLWLSSVNNAPSRMGGRLIDPATAVPYHRRG